MVAASGSKRRVQQDAAATRLQARWRGGKPRAERKALVQAQAHSMFMTGGLSGRWKRKTKTSRANMATQLQSSFRGHRVRSANREGAIFLQAALLSTQTVEESLREKRAAQENDACVNG